MDKKRGGPAATGPQQRADARRKLRRLDVAEMVATPPPPVPWRIKDIAADGALTMLYAQPGEGKSLIAATFSGAVVSGESIAGIGTLPGSVLYIDAENGAWEIHRRVHQLGLSAEGIEFYEGGAGFDLRKDWREVERLLDEHEPDLVVLDSLRSLAPGLEENDSGDTEAAIGPIRRLAHDRNVAVILIHHTSKPGHTYRGNSAIMAGVDIGYRMGRATDDPVRGRRSLTCQKMRIGPEPPTRWLKIEFEHGMVFVSEAEPHETDEQPRPAPVRNKLGPEVEAVVREQGPIRLANIARALDRDPKDQSVRRALGALDGVEQDEDGCWRVSGVTPPSRGDTVTPAPSTLDELEAALNASATDGPELVRT